MNFNDLKAKALNKKQMRAIKGGSGTCGYAHGYRRGKLVL